MLRIGVGICGCACALALVKSAAAAEPERERGFSLRLRTAVAFPAGEQDNDHDLADTFGVLVPVELEAGYWVLPRLLIGARGAVGLLTVADESCAPPLECGGTSYRFGAVVEYAFDRGGKFRKWGSAGVGYEIARLAIHRDSSSASRVDSGPEYLHAELGGDFALGGSFAVGPFLGASIAEFRTATLRQGDGSEASYSIQESKLHEWYFIGVRGTWDP
jgi:hypothetical protein